MTVGELKRELDRFGDDEIIIAGIPFWECAVATDLRVARYTGKTWMFSNPSGHGGGIVGLETETIESVVAITHESNLD